MSEQLQRGSPEHRARIIQNIRRWCDEIRQLLIDVEHWNRVHPNEEPIDIDPGGQLRQMLSEGEEMLARDPGHGPLAPFTYVIGPESGGVS
jgi:hypothetical protein